jgi:hypothetical protein
VWEVQRFLSAAGVPDERGRLVQMRQFSPWSQSLFGLIDRTLRRPGAFSGYPLSILWPMLTSSSNRPRSSLFANLSFFSNRKKRPTKGSVPRVNLKLRIVVQPEGVP